jgi:SAM-dependent methyltransferase
MIKRPANSASARAVKRDAMTEGLFGNLAGLYDALIDWPRRLANEEPFYRQLFDQIGAHRVLDVACGTGRHAAMFHSWGLRVDARDASPQMIDRCRELHGESDSLRWTVRAFDEASDASAAYDVVTCVGNSLALAPNLETAGRAVRAMLAAVRPGGVCVLHVLNIWHLPDGPCVWQKCKRITLAGAEYIVFKGVHRVGARGFVELAVAEHTGDTVTPHSDTTPLLGLDREYLAYAAREAGAAATRCYGDYQHAPYDRERSVDLIVVAEK